MNIAYEIAEAISFYGRKGNVKKFKNKRINF